MGNSLGCSAHGERLVAAARDGDVAESRRLLEINRSLARYSTFAGLSSPLHAAAAGGHSEIVTMLLDNGADVNSRNSCGQTALMHACRYGHWETVQTLLLFRCNVLKIEYLSGRTALHFSAAGGHARCVRLLAADFVPNVSHANADSLKDDRNVSIPNSASTRGYDKYGLSRYVNKAASGGMSALHFAALTGNSDCVHLLLDLGADVSAVTQFYASSTTAIGAGCTPLHYAASSGNLKCCQILLARGASRLVRNYDGLLPSDIARIWECYWLVPLLSPHSSLSIPVFPPSDYLSLPLTSILKIAREHGLQSSPATPDESDLCAVCLERACTVAAEGCGHELCTGCALCLCSSSNTKSEIASAPGSIPCPLCRDGIVSFTPLVDKFKGADTNLCDRSDIQPHDEKSDCMSDFHKNSLKVFPSELTGPMSSSTYENSTWQSSGTETNLDMKNEEKLEETSCSASFVNGSSSQGGPERNIKINS